MSATHDSRHPADEPHPADDRDATDERGPDVLYEVLCRTHDVLDGAGIWHCLLFGTLLGAIREGDIIAWDHDVDLLVRPVDVDRILALNATLARDDLWFWESRSPAARLALNPDRIPFFELGNVGVMRGEECFGELYAPVLFDDGVMRCYDLEREVAFWPRSAFPAYVVQELAEARVRERAFPVPAHADQLLTWHYGPDWRIPYRSVRDGGEPSEGLTDSGDLAAPGLHERVRWCEMQGWDRRVYADQPAWARDVRAAGPPQRSARAAASSRSEWWRTLEEIRLHY